MFNIVRLFGIGGTPTEEITCADVLTLGTASTMAAAVSTANPTDEIYVKDPQTGAVPHKYVNGALVW